MRNTIWYLDANTVCCYWKYLSCLLTFAQEGCSKMRTLETRCTENLIKDGELSGLCPSPAPFLPPVLRQNVQQVLVESPGWVSLIHLFSYDPAQEVLPGQDPDNLAFWGGRHAGVWPLGGCWASAGGRRFWAAWDGSLELRRQPGNLVCCAQHWLQSKPNDWLESPGPRQLLLWPVQELELQLWLWGSPLRLPLAGALLVGKHHLGAEQLLPRLHLCLPNCCWVLTGNHTIQRFQC